MKEWFLLNIFFFKVKKSNISPPDLKSNNEEGIHFDYRLTPGVSVSANARYLMKMIGIE